MEPNTFTNQEIAGLVDLTNLSVVSTSEDIAKLCVAAVQHQVATVCVWPRFVRGAANCLNAHGIGVATVVNFPHGTQDVHKVAGAAQQAVANGATEIDLVLPYSDFAAGNRNRSENMIRTVVAVTDGVPVKVIIESGELPNLQTIRDAAEFSYIHGARFVKTSTGTTPVGVTPEAAEVLFHVAKEFGGAVKLSGGIKTVEQATEYLAMAEFMLGRNWITPANFRFGASSLVTNLGGNY